RGDGAEVGMEVDEHRAQALPEERVVVRDDDAGRSRHRAHAAGSMTVTWPPGWSPTRTEPPSSAAREAIAQGAGAPLGKPTPSSSILIVISPVNFAVVSFDVAGSFAGAIAQSMAPLPSCRRTVTGPCGAPARG